MHRLLVAVLVIALALVAVVPVWAQTAATATAVASEAPAAPSTASTRPATPSSSAKRTSEPSTYRVETGPPSEGSDVHPASTPRRAFAGFLKACAKGDYATAAEALDLRGLPRGRDPREAAELAAMLYRVLGWRVSLAPDALPDEPAPQGVGAEGIVLDVVEVDGKPYTLALAPVRQPNGEVRWMFPRSTVAAIRTIYDANERLVLEERVPDWMKRAPLLGLMPWQWLGLLVILVVAYLIGRVIGSVGARLVLRVARPFSRTVSDAAKGLERPTRLAIAVTLFVLCTPYLLFVASLARTLEKISTTAYIVAAAWAAIAIMRVLTTSWERRLPDDTLGDLASRGLRTRLAMMRRIGTVLVGLLAAGVALLQFDVVRSVGVSLLASAGIAGILIGIAAQRTLGGVIAGIEMSITQPMRIGDVVVFRPGEQGVVEEIYFTYVIIRLWDDRRLIVPVQRVMAEAFENWTRTDARVLATVEIFVDYSAPLDDLRRSFRALCEDNERWDGRVCRVEVVDATDKAMKIRGVASVDVATKALDLRNDLREGWILFLQNLDSGRYLPVGRVESREARKPAAAVTSNPTP